MERVDTGPLFSQLRMRGFIPGLFQECHPLLPRLLDCCVAYAVAVALCHAFTPSLASPRLSPISSCLEPLVVVGQPDHVL